ncbi:P-loop containing nucleoside triphosphate hydrolase protein [Cenococcum geophilum]
MRRWLERRAKGPANTDASSASTSTISSTTPPASRKVFPSGIKLLHKTTDSVVDIIFIHGLTGDREKTWTAKGAAAPWPQTLLPLKVPNARILTFGYDAYIANWRGMVSQNRIGNHAMNLLAAVAAFRDDDDTEVALTVAESSSSHLRGHSLGGLVCENALVIADQRPEKHLKSILELTRGIVFLGTPHHGSSLARWAEMLARSIGLFKQTNPEILQVLKTDSEVLAHIQDSFHTMIRSRAGATLPLIDITCFYEELPLPGVGTVVPSHSAILPGYIPIGIRNNHINMTKFENANDPGFAIFAGELRRWVKHLAAVENTGVPEVITAQPSQAEQRQDRAQLPFPHITFSGPENYGSQVGYNTGSVTNNFNLPTERPETPPIPLSTVPFSRDPDFVERKTMLDQIHSKCSMPASRTALVGLGGVGKSQLAIEYSYRVREQSPGTWVFWIHASNAARFEQSFCDVADQVKLPGRRNPKIDIFKAVHDWLRDEKHGRWIVVLDNADDARFLVESAPTRQSAQAGSVTTQPLSAYLPRSQNGSVLITTRNKSVALRLVEERNIIAVEPMDEVHAVDLLDRKLGYQNDAKDTAELAAALEFMPLAIVQAAAYICHRTPRYSVRQYLEKFRKNDRQKSRLLGDDTGQFRRDWDAKNSIIITWQISFDHVQQTRPSAADLLSLMSLFDRQGIPEDLLRDRSEAQNEGDEGSPHISGDNEREDSKDGASVSSMDEFEDDLLVLRDCSFVFGANSTTLEMHRLVQLATRKWLETHGQLERWKRQYVKNLCAAFPTGEYENWGVCQALFPHAKAALEQKPEGERALLQWASVLYKAACL